MSKKHSLVDGFIPRQSGDKLGSLHKVEHRSLSARQVNQRVMYTKDHSEATKLQSSNASRRTLGRADIDESLNSIDRSSEVDKKIKKRKNKRHSGIRPKKSLAKRIVRWAVLLIVLGLLGAGIYTGVKFMIAGGNIFQGNFFDLIKNEPLKTDSNGRTNILIFGMSPDERQEDPYLTDSMIVLSIDQETKDAFMVSFPRDLWVRYDEPCVVGYQGKLNATYLCGSNQGKDNAAGVSALKSKISEISGLEIQYNVSVNWGVLTKVVDTLGGIEVDLPDAIYDPMTKLNLPEGKSHLDGEMALSLSRSRYGVSGGDFGRALNQQRVMKAILEKASSTGALTDLGKVTSLVDAFGDNLKTNIEMKEVRTFMDVASKVDINNVESLDLADPDDPLVNTGSYNGQSIVKPILGISNFSDIRAAIKREL
jgi:LCP family protein required for cell wall assembly